jgi:hypothetical protein
LLLGKSSKGPLKTLSKASSSRIKDFSLFDTLVKDYKSDPCLLLEREDYE